MKGAFQNKLIKFPVNCHGCFSSSDLQHASFSLFQEQYWRSVVFHNHVDYLSKNGYELDESAKSQAVKEQQELLMKLFAVSTNRYRIERISETLFWVDGIWCKF